jgi:hypothetical protein
MATIIVKQDGSGDYTNLTDAFAAAAAFDTIEIQDSETYNEGNLSRVRSDLTIKAGTGYTPTLDGGGTLDCAIKFYNDWVIDGLIITNYDGTATSGAGLISVAGNRVVTIKNCTLHNLADDAIAGIKTGSVIENCVIYNVHTLVSARGINGSVQSPTITQCLLYDIIDDGIIATGASTLIKQCTLYNVGYGSVGSYGILASLGTVQHCIVDDPNHRLSNAGVRASSHSYNCVSGSEDSSNGNFYGGAGTGDTESDPLISSSSFRLSAGSPCIGTAVGSTLSTDLRGGSRDWEYSHAVMGVNVGATPHDMGAIEFTYTTVDGEDTATIASVMGVSD